MLREYRMAIGGQVDLQDEINGISNHEYVSTNLAQDLVKSIGSDQADLVMDISELTIKSVFDGAISNYDVGAEGLPLIKTAAGLYKLCKGVSSFYYINKLLAFIQGVEKCAASKSDANWFRDKFSGSSKEQDRYVEYLLIVIDRYVGYEKPQMLAKLFIAFVDGYISWEELTCFAEMLERLLPGDYKVLAESNTYRQNPAATPSAVLRLVGLGLMVEASRPSALKHYPNGNFAITQSSLNAIQKNEIEYSRTPFGSKLVDIIQGSYEA